MTHTLEVARHLARGRPGAAPERGSDRGRRARGTTSATRRSATPARRPPPRCLKRARLGVPAQRALAAHGGRARARRGRPEPDRRGARRHPQPHRRCRPGQPRGPDRAPGRPLRVREPRHRRCRAGGDPRSGQPPSDRACSRSWAAARLERIDALVHDLAETSERGGRHRESPRRFEPRCSDLRSYMFEHVYLGPQARGARARAPGTMVRGAFFASPGTRAVTHSRPPPTGWRG